MTVAPERPRSSVGHLLQVADTLAGTLPGHRVEILGGQLVVTPPVDGAHGEALTDAMSVLMAAGLHGSDARLIQAIGVWLPEGDDYAIPDLAVVDADYRDHHVRFNCYDPAVFRLVWEVTSSNRVDDLHKKPHAYASAGVPVYLVVDRQRCLVLLYTDPRQGRYGTRTEHRPGEICHLPASVGAPVSVEVDALLGPAPTGPDRDRARSRSSRERRWGPGGPGGR